MYDESSPNKSKNHTTSRSTSSCYSKVPPRSKICINVPANINKEYICHKKEIFPGVFISNCIGAPCQGYVTVGVLNTTENEFEINKPLELDLDLTQFKIQFKRYYKI